MTTRIQVVVVMHNCKDDVAPCLESVLRWLPGVAIAVIDNASSDGTAERLRAYGDRITLIEPGQNLGFARANNLALRSTTADYYLLLNPDAWLTNDVVADILRAYPDQSELQIAGPRIVNTDGSHQSSAYAFTTPLKWVLQILVPEGPFRRRLGTVGRLPVLRRVLPRLPAVGTWFAGHAGERANEPARQRVDWVTFACTLFSRRVIEATNGLDDNFFIYCDDEEFCFRARKLGFHTERVNAGPVVHRLGWQANQRNQLGAPMYQSLKYLIDKHNADRPVRRWLLHRLLPLRFRVPRALASGTAAPQPDAVRLPREGDRTA